MSDYITPADLSAVNSAVQATESYHAAKRGAEGIIERLSASRDAAGLSDSDIYNALSRGASNKSGFHWLNRMLGILTEYLGSWGTLVLIAISFLATFALIKQNAASIWSEISSFFKNHPLLVGFIGGAALSGGAAYMLRDADSDTAADALTSAVTSTLPLPLVAAITGFATRISTSGRSVYTPAATTTTTGGANSYKTALTGDVYVRDAFVRDGEKPYVLRDKNKPYTLRDDTMSGNLGV